MIEMEYADGGTLRDKIVEADQTHFAEPEIVWFVWVIVYENPPHPSLNLQNK
jgi:hypothetical protein